MKRSKCSKKRGVVARGGRAQNTKQSIRPDKLKILKVKTQTSHFKILKLKKKVWGTFSFNNTMSFFKYYNIDRFGQYRLVLPPLWTL